MPVSSLPSSQGIGTLGKGAYAFIDWLESAGMQVWQVLPLVPTGYGDSPYQSCASDALNHYFIDFELLKEDGLLEENEYAEIKWSEDERRVDYGKQFACKIYVLKQAFARFDRQNKAWQNFLKDGKYADYALFMTLKTQFPAILKVIICCVLEIKFTLWIITATVISMQRLFLKMKIATCRYHGIYGR